MITSPPNWCDIDTVFLDMDGTLLDLNYDNQVWNHAVPQAYAEARGISPAEAKKVLLEHMHDIRGTIEFYSFDYWNEYTGLNLIDIHKQHTELIQYRSGALAFLRWLAAQNKLTIIATNAHRDSVRVKDDKIKISAEVAAVVSSQDYKAPKESLTYWQAMHVQFPFDPERAIFIDDNEPVLDHAREYGINHLWAISQPDSQRPAKTSLSYPSFNTFYDLCNELEPNPRG